MIVIACADEADEEVTRVNADTPIARAAVNQISVDALDEMLLEIRLRRLERVRKLEAIAQVRADEARLTTFMKYEKAYRRARSALEKLQQQEDKVEALVHRARLLAMECGL